jgi:hypothetical protein
VEAKVAPTAPAWIRRRMAAHDANLLSERARREQAEDRVEAVSKQLKEEVQKNAGDARELVGARASIEKLERELSESRSALELASREKSEHAGRVGKLLLEITDLKAATEKHIARARLLEGKFTRGEPIDVDFDATAQPRQQRTKPGAIEGQEITWRKIMGVLPAALGIALLAGIFAGAVASLIAFTLQAIVGAVLSNIVGALTRGGGGLVGRTITGVVGGGAATYASKNMNAVYNLTSTWGHLIAGNSGVVLGNVITGAVGGAILGIIGGLLIRPRS